MRKPSDTPANQKMRFILLTKANKTFIQPATRMSIFQLGNLTTASSFAGFLAVTSSFNIPFVRKFKTRVYTIKALDFWN